MNDVDRQPAAACAALALGLVLGLSVLSGCGSSQPAAPAASSSTGAASADACAGQDSWPSAALPASDANLVDATQFIPQQQLQTWGQELDNLGLRATGNPAHQANIAVLEARLKCAGVQDVHLEDVPLDHYMSTDQWTLSIPSGASAGSVKVAGYMPYTGPTPTQGLTAPLVYQDANTASTAANSAGKIVVFDLTTSLLPDGVPTPVAAFLLYAMGTYQLVDRLAEIYSRPYLGIGDVVTRMNDLVTAGAAGAIAICPGGYTASLGAYFPYDYVQRSVPGLFVDTNVGAQLKALASSGTQATITITGDLTPVTTQNIIGIIPGASDELTVINSHTDGTNGLEDNGPNAIVGIAQYLARLPQSALPRTVMIMLSAGHFTAGSGIQQFLKVHASDGTLQRIASITTIEHLGSQDWELDADADLKYNGEPELGAIFLPQIQKFADASYDFFINADAGAGAVLKPLSASGTGTADDAIWPGEGQYFWGLGHIPTANYITGPSYLLNWGVTTADKIDFDRMEREMVAFAQMQLDLSRLSVADLSTQSSLVVTTGSGKYGLGLAP
jgi:hypothetical protein